MSEEEKEETVEEAPVEETPAEEPAAEETPVEETPAEEPAAEEAPAEDSGSDEAGEAPASEGDSDEGEDEFGDMSWKDRARLLKSREPVEAKPQMSPEERNAEREADRAKTAKVRRTRREKAKAEKKPSADGKGGTPPAEKVRTGKPKERQGVVVSSKADKTITVRIDTARRHPVYEMIVRQSHKIYAHDETNEAGEGDVVRVIETRKLSRTKHWRLIEIVEKAR